MLRAAIVYGISPLARWPSRSANSSSVVVAAFIRFVFGSGNRLVGYKYVHVLMTVGPYFAEFVRTAHPHVRYSKPC